MRIDDRNITGAAAGRAAQAQEAQKTGSGGLKQAAAGSFGDSVEFSPGLDQLARAVSAFGSDRESRISALTALYQGGLYKPDPVATSRAIISDALNATAV